jgi:diguanylate cyclase (GGDEF)-like protein
MATSLYKKIVDFITLRIFSVRQKLILYAVSGLAWFLLMTAIGFYTVYIINQYAEKTFVEIIPHDKTAQKVIRKLRGASISAHKIVLYDDPDVMNNSYLRCKDRLVDSEKMLKAILEGGYIVDVSVGTGQLYEKLRVLPSHNSDTIKTARDALENIKGLLSLITDIYTSKTAGDDAGAIEGLIDYDILTRETIIDLFEISISSTKLYLDLNRMIKNTIFRSSVLSIGIFLVAVSLLIFYTRMLSRHIGVPILFIKNQLESLSEGDVDLKKRIKVDSTDEIGELANNFNRLLDNVHNINFFKKIIERDESVQDVYSRLAQIFKDELHLEHFILFEVSDSKNKMWVSHISLDEENDILCNQEILINCNLCRAKKTGSVVSSFEFKRICKQFLHPEEMQHICVPMTGGGGSTVGVAQFIFAMKEDLCINEKRCISSARRYITEAIPAIESKRLTETLRQSSLKDSLTGLYNRRFLEEYQDALIAEVTRQKSIVGLLMCDLDFFKEVNDTYGHDIGDIVLNEVAKVIKSTIRQSDLAIRFGGEEFLVLLKNVEKDSSVNVAEKVRKEMEERKIVTVAGTIQKTVSIGVSEFPVDGENFWQVIKFADVALYRAKETGRNKVVRFTADMWKEETY